MAFTQVQEEKSKFSRVLEEQESLQRAALCGLCKYYSATFIFLNFKRIEASKCLLNNIDWRIQLKNVIKM